MLFTPKYFLLNRNTHFIARGARARVRFGNIDRWTQIHAVSRHDSSKRAERVESYLPGARPEIGNTATTTMANARAYTRKNVEYNFRRDKSVCS